MQQQGQQYWYQQTWFTESNWVSTSTKWFLTFSGKLARIVLTFATLYMSAELYPGVKFPDALNLAVFIILSFALDMGGLGLGQIAKTAKEHGDVEGAAQGKKLSQWLIRIMIAGLVTVSLEAACAKISFPAPVKGAIGMKDYINIAWSGIDIALTIARLICAVNYGHVLNDLEKSIEHSQTKIQQTQQANDALALENKEQLVETDQRIDNLSLLLERVHQTCTEQAKHIQTLSEHVQKHGQTIDTGIDTRINQLATSVTEIHNNVLQITQNNQYVHTPYTRPYTDVSEDVQGGYTVEEAPTNTAVASSKAAPVIPLLDVPGVSQERITEVITLVKNGASWTKVSQELSLNYSRDVKPIKEAYEQYQASGVHAQ